VIASIRDQGSIVRRMLGAPVLRAVGERAYSLYLWQVGVFWLVWRLLGSDRPWVAAMAAVLVLSVTVELSFRLLEKPVLHQP
jgi:peptidoglycan/LPS O-acetylase OafA/YrhL